MQRATITIKWFCSRRNGTKVQVYECGEVDLEAKPLRKSELFDDKFVAKNERISEKYFLMREEMAEKRHTHTHPPSRNKRHKDFKKFGIAAATAASTATTAPLNSAWPRARQEHKKLSQQ